MAGAVNESLCVWKTRDGKSVMHNFSELITTVQFKPLQDNGKNLLQFITYSGTSLIRKIWDQRVFRLGLVKCMLKALCSF